MVRGGEKGKYMYRYIIAGSMGSKTKEDDTMEGKRRGRDSSSDGVPMRQLKTGRNLLPCIVSSPSSLPWQCNGLRMRNPMPRTRFVAFYTLVKWGGVLIISYPMVTVLVTQCTIMTGDIKISMVYQGFSKSLNFFGGFFPQLENFILFSTSLLALRRHKYFTFISTITGASSPSNETIE